MEVCHENDMRYHGFWIAGVGVLSAAYTQAQTWQAVPEAQLFILETRKVDEIQVLFMALNN